MYTDGFRQLWQGWTKNIFTGASNIPVLMLILIILQISAYSTAVYVVINAFIGSSSLFFIASILSYLLCGFQIYFIGRKLGNFHPVSSVFYPVFLAGFIAMFLVSAFQKLVLKRTKWKGRDVPL
jgi:4,4'-diaponeurosporenoate glycosyltransferase